MTKRLDYTIHTQRLYPSLGAYEYAAGVRFYPEGGAVAPHDFGEAWGRTEDEAKAKMRAKVDAWLKEQGIPGSNML